MERQTQMDKVEDHWPQLLTPCLGKWLLLWHAEKAGCTLGWVSLSHLQPYFCSLADETHKLLGPQLLLSLSWVELTPTSTPSPPSFPSCPNPPSSTHTQCLAWPGSWAAGLHGAFVLPCAPCSCHFLHGTCHSECLFQCACLLAVAQPPTRSEAVREPRMWFPFPPLFPQNLMLFPG